MRGRSGLWPTIVRQGLAAVATAVLVASASACSGGEPSFEDRVEEHFLDSRYVASLEWRGRLERVECEQGLTYRLTSHLYACRLQFRRSGLEDWAVVEDPAIGLQMVACGRRNPDPARKKSAGPISHGLYYPACPEG